MCPEKINSLKIISLSARIVVQRAEDTGSNINSKFKDKTNDFKWFSLALDESTDVNNIGQLFLFIQGSNTKFEVTKELACKGNRARTTTGKNH
jgi:hypothetical protein